MTRKSVNCFVKGEQALAFVSVSYLVVEGSDLVGQHAVFVHQKTEASLLLQQSLLTAVCDEQLHVHLTTRQCFQALKHTQPRIHR